MLRPNRTRWRQVHMQENHACNEELSVFGKGGGNASIQNGTVTVEQPEGEKHV